MTPMNNGKDLPRRSLRPMRRAEAWLYLLIAGFISLSFPAVLAMSVLDSSNHFSEVILAPFGFSVVAAIAVFKYLSTGSPAGVSRGQSALKDKDVFRQAIRAIHLDPERWMWLGYLLLGLPIASVIVYFMFQLSTP